MSAKLSHIDDKGRASMVDVGEKDITVREAEASGRIQMKPETLALIVSGGMPKGDVFAAARIAGIQGGKKTSEMIPLCHPLLVEKISVDFEIDEVQSCVLIRSFAKITGKTGIEMEALTAVSIAALTIYDMCKAVDKNITITDIMLIRKSGGKSGEYVRK